MREQRKTTVEHEDIRFLEYDRDVKITLHHSDNMSTTLKLSETEAATLWAQLGEELDRRRRERQKQTGE